MSVSVNGTNGLTFNDGSTQNTSPFAGGLGFRNRIINGACMIDQRNAGAAVTTAGSFPVDRFYASNTSDGAFSMQQDTSAPAGFTKSIKYTTTTADASLTTTQQMGIIHRIEGTNVFDLGWGAVGAATVTLSFWVRSSLTGTFGGAVKNSDGSRSYPFSYTISSANTWEQKAVTIAGDTTGTWLTDTGTGILLLFALGAGPDRSGTANTWASANYSAPTGATSVIGTLNATFYITGVQLEKGSTATSFDYRPYGTELALCQRYYYKQQAVALNSTFCLSNVANTTQASGFVSFPVQMRTAPTALDQSGTAGDYKIGGTSCSSVPTFLSGDVWNGYSTFTVASGLTAGQCLAIRSTGTGAYLAWSAEL